MAIFSNKITIAVDGYSSCGKSTLSNDLAHALSYTYIDTGAMYRAVTLHCMEKKIISANAFSAQGIIAELPNIKLEFSDKSEIYLNGKKCGKRNTYNGSGIVG